MQRRTGGPEVDQEELTHEHVLGYPVIVGALDDCVMSIAATMRNEGRRGWLACLNPHSYVVSLNDSEFSQALRSADWVIPDGSGIVLASRLHGGAIRQRITGSDIFRALNLGMNKMGGFSVFFLGSTPEVLEEIRVRMSRDFPNVYFAGSYSPPYKPEYTEEENMQMISAINEAAPDVLWVGMTAPKQEKWLHHNLPHLNVKFAAAVGAVFDFYTGRVKRSHPVFQRLGLEWLPRLMQEPRRLWRRNFVSTPIFLWHVVLGLGSRSPRQRG